MTGLMLQRLAVFVYFLSAAGFLVFFFRRNKKAAVPAERLLGLGFVLHSVSLAFRTADLGQVPILNLAEALGFFAWAVVGVHFLLLIKFRLHVVGVFASILALLLAASGLILTRGEGLSLGPVFQSLWLTFHLGSVFTGYGFFGLAFLAGLMYLLQEREIKAKRPGALFKRLPSLNVLDSLNHFCLTLGFPFMTLGIITGAAYAHSQFGRYWRWDPKEVWTLILWLFYAALLHQRLMVGWRGRRAAYMAIIGFVLLAGTFIGVSLFMPGYHSFENLRRLQVQ